MEGTQGAREDLGGEVHAGLLEQLVHVRPRRPGPPSLQERLEPLLGTPQPMLAGHPQVRGQVGEVLGRAPEVTQLPVDDAQPPGHDEHRARPQIAHDQAAARALEPTPQLLEALAPGRGILDAPVGEPLAHRGVLELVAGALDGGVVKARRQLLVPPGGPMQAPDEVAQRPGVRQRALLADGLEHVPAGLHPLHDHDPGALASPQQPRRAHHLVGQRLERPTRPQQRQRPGLETQPRRVQRDLRVRGQVRGRPLQDQRRRARGHPPGVVQEPARERARGPGHLVCRARA